ncbi:LCP family protein [Candidatus Peregrinibacteria bacterium]|nr:MAG: LCP family protein [Candidatus Peregrinibacteria bacterium]
MNPFHTHPIQKLQKKEQFNKKAVQAERWIHSHWILSLIALVLGLLTLKGVYGTWHAGHSISVKQIFMEAVGSGLKTDGQGHTNILLLGVGGEGHDGENLTDTMIVASLNQSENTVSMVSIPRDLYVETEAVGWGTRVNSIYELVYDESEDRAIAEAALEEELESMMNIDIQYYAKIDFNSFKEIIDAVDGITVNVTEDIADLAYPADPGSSSVYDPFYLSVGTHTLDGETALKYVRSRHNTSDFSRAQRQQEVLQALKDKATSLGVLTSPSKIKDLYSAIANNFESNMSLTELLALAEFGSDLEEGAIQNAVFNDLAYTKGGFLYTPEREEGDPYYLFPYAGDFSELALFARVFLYHPEIARDQVTIRVLNGTKTSSLAGLTKMMLVRYGFNALPPQNAETKDVIKTQIYLLPTSTEEEQEIVERTAQLIPLLVDGEISEDVPPAYQSDTEAQIVIVLGADFASFYAEHEELFYIGFY